MSSCVIVEILLDGDGVSMIIFDFIVACAASIIGELVRGVFITIFGTKVSGGAISIGSSLFYVGNFEGYQGYLSWKLCENIIEHVIILRHIVQKK